MRLIDADALAERISKLKSTICSRAAGWVEEDSYECGAVDGLLDVLQYIEEAETIPHDMKWNPDCEDCLPEGINDCIECHQRQNGGDRDA